MKKRKIGSLMTYLIRDIPPPLWKRVKIQAIQDGLSVRAVLIRLLEVYAKDQA